ncbi:unnamed protein product [Bemisia tabaci]|uniref:Pre-C2HC domain-containing protein n=1 Tax=Bemisia tabaci TaxID=7038 RepID=A0A9P0F9R3_BEMTA|nr:unnamed protein product [Bemisia tabaci]
MQIVNKSQVKVIVKNREEYNTLFNHFKSQNISFHTYQFKECKTIKRMIRGLPSDYLIDDIKTSLVSQGLSVINITQIRHFITKAPMPLFTLEIEASPVVAKKLEKINSINNLIVKFEFLKKSRVIAQCQNCMAYGHTKHYCHRQPRCVICGEFHAVDECNRKKESLLTLTPLVPTCALCGGQHLGNYRGCRVYKDIKKKRLSKFVNHKAIPPTNLTTSTKNLPKNAASYANALKGNSQPNKTNDNRNDAIQFYQAIDKRLNTLERLVSAQAEQISSLLSTISTLVQWQSQNSRRWENITI